MTRPRNVHVGPWTLADLLDPPDDGNRYEVIEGVAHVSPAPSRRHAAITMELGVVLHHAVPDGLRVYSTGAGVDLGTSFLIPDVVVVRETEDTPCLAPSEVVLAVEVESPSSRRIDRIRKPRVLAKHAVPHYWRVETGPELTVVTYRLGEGGYVETGRASGPEVLTAGDPFRLRLRPDDLDRPAATAPAVRSGPS